MASIVSIRDGLATRLDTIAGLRVTSYAPDKLTPPAAVVGEVAVTFDETFGRGLDEITCQVRVYASRADDRTGQDKLDAYLAGSGTSSIKAAIEGDRTLGGAAETLRVVRLEGYGVYEVAGLLYVGAEFTVTIWARGS